VRVHLELKRTRDRLNRLGRHFSSYLSAEVATGIRRGVISQGVINQRKPLTVFFSDIVEFTKQTAALPPERMARMLNGYFDAMADIVCAHHGTLDKYIGDACMVFFGDPTSRGTAEDARACVHMALEMQVKIDELQTFWAEQGSGSPLAVRMGIATGLCAVGNFGSTHQLAYTVMGTAVNLASRLQSHATPGHVLISQETYDLVAGDFVCVPLPELHVKGLADPIAAYAVDGVVSP
jgi:class 3 adenylate cyclase